jgi:hypothetical protein
MANPFLSAIGVPALDQARPPTVKGFPQGLNTNNVSQWTSAVHELIPSGEAEKDWALTLKRYVQFCEHDAVFPFSDVNELNNDRIHDILLHSRQYFVKFVDRFKFFDDVAIRSTHRKVAMTDTGFVLTVYAKARIEDPSFVDWLEHLPQPYKFPFTRTADFKYKKQLTPHLSVFVQNETVTLPERWHVGYEISVPMFPDIPSNQLPSKAEIERFILDYMWMPLLRSMRPIGMAHRLI